MARKNQVLVLTGLLMMVSVITGSVLKKSNYIFASQEWSYYSVVADNPVPDPDLIKASPRLLYAKYKANRNDTFNSLAAVFGTDVQTLKGSNISMLPSVRSGDVLNVLNRSGLLYACSANDTLYSLSKKFLPKNASIDSFRQEIVNENLLPPSALITDYVFQEGENVFFPGVFVSPEKKFVKSSNGTNRSKVVNKLYVYPLKYKRLSSRFGYRSHPTKKKAIFHKGCDFQAPLGTPVYAARAGVVRVSGWERGYGNTVEIIHPDGYITRYAHLSQINVKKGDSVVQGKSKIGEVGKSGIATGYHLHFELITPKGKVIDPLPNIKKSAK